MWSKVSTGKKETVDGETVELLCRITEQTGTEDIKLLFWPKNSDETPIFPGMSENDRKTSYQQVVTYRNAGRPFRSFKNIAQQARNTLLRFYNIIEQIPIWFDPDATRGYSGGTSLMSRPRVETILAAKFGIAGYAAIMIYVLVHWDVMFEVGKNVTCDDPSYPQRFKYSVWYDLAKLFFERWKVQPIFQHYVSFYKSIKTLRVNSHIIGNFTDK
jgi:hypothetical protein